jgi:hypothetical protein
VARDGVGDLVAHHRGDAVVVLVYSKIPL